MNFESLLDNSSIVNACAWVVWLASTANGRTKEKAFKHTEKKKVNKKDLIFSILNT